MDSITAYRVSSHLSPIYISLPFPPRPISPTHILPSGRMIFSLPPKLFVFSLDPSLCTSCVGFVGVRYCAFVYLSDWIGLDWTGLYPPLPPHDIS